MADPVLTAGQYSIGVPGSSAALVYGRGTSIFIENTATDTGAVIAQDSAVVGHDGMLFGVDTLPGMVVTQTGYAYTSPSLGAVAMDAYSALAGAWNDPAIRLSNGTVVTLRAFYPGSAVVRRAYGRGRKILPTMGKVYQGVVPFVAQFQCADNTWYSDTEASVTLTQTPSYRGTITPPLTPPYQLAAAINYQQNTMINTGSLPTWPVITFTGPISYPGVTYLNTPVTIGYSGILGNTDTLVIDTRPWARTAMLNVKTSVAGLLTGQPMIALQAQPGATVLKFSGQDYSGQSTCVVRWRNASLAIGGSS